MDKGKRTALSAGIIIRDILAKDEKVKVNKIYPVVTDCAELPYIVYRRIALQNNPVKKGLYGADAVRIEVLCLTSDYSGGVELAEAVRGALECAQHEKDGLTMRGCTMEDSEELWQDDAYIQRLIFNVKI